MLGKHHIKHLSLQIEKRQKEVASIYATITSLQDEHLKARVAIMKNEIVPSLKWEAKAADTSQIRFETKVTKAVRDILPDGEYMEVRGDDFRISYWNHEGVFQILIRFLHAYSSDDAVKMTRLIDELGINDVDTLELSNNIIAICDRISVLTDASKYLDGKNKGRDT